MITIHGQGGHGKVIADALGEGPGWEMRSSVRFTDDADDTQPEPGDRFIVAVGDPDVRRKYNGNTTVIHSSAYVSPAADIFEGVYVGANAVVNPDARVGRGTIINTGAVVEHDCQIGPFSHIAPNATLCGGVKVGESVLIGAGAVVKPGIHIGDRATIGCGSVVVKDIPSGETWVGNPAKLLKTGSCPDFVHEGDQTGPG